MVIKYVGMWYGMCLYLLWEDVLLVVVVVCFVGVDLFISIGGGLVIDGIKVINLCLD